MSDTTSKERHRVKRLHKRGFYDRETIDRVLDAGFVCHVGYVAEGFPIVIPTIYWRDGDHVYWHGSSASRTLRANTDADVCVTVTHADGLVLARSGFHHSLNYRSVVMFGTARKVEDTDEKQIQLERFVETLFPGRWSQLRPMTTKEIKATSLLSLPITEASAKIRTGPPVDDEDDYGLPVWAGVVPLTTGTGVPVACPRLDPSVPFPDHAKIFFNR